MLELTCGRLDGSWITETGRKHFHIFFPCEYIVRLSRNILGLAYCSAAVIYGGGPPTTGLRG